MCDKLKKPKVIEDLQKAGDRALEGVRSTLTGAQDVLTEGGKKFNEYGAEINAAGLQVAQRGDARDLFGSFVPNTDQDFSKVDLSFGHSLNLDQTLPDNTPNWDQLKPNLDQDLSKISVRGLQESAVKQGTAFQEGLVKIGTAGQEAAVQAGKAGQQALVAAGSAAQTNFQTLGTDLQREAVNFGSAFQQEAINLGSGAQKMAVEIGSAGQQAAIDIASLTGIRNETAEKYIAQITGGTEDAGQQVTKGAELFADKATKGVEFGVSQITKGAELFADKATKGAENVIAQGTKYAEEKVIPAYADAIAFASGDKNPVIKFGQTLVKAGEAMTPQIEQLGMILNPGKTEGTKPQVTTGDNLAPAPTIGDEAVFPEMEEATTKARADDEEDRLRKIRRLMLNRYGREKTILGSPGDTISRRRYAL